MEVRQAYYLGLFVVGVLGAYLIYRSQFGESTRFFKPERANENSSKKNKVASNKKIPTLEWDHPIKKTGEPHEILGVPKTATRSEIKTAFKKLMKLYHPDKIARSKNISIEESNKISQILIQAKNALLKKLP